MDERSLLGVGCHYALSRAFFLGDFNGLMRKDVFLSRRYGFLSFSKARNLLVGSVVSGLVEDLSCPRGWGCRACVGCSLGGHSYGGGAYYAYAFPNVARGLFPFYVSNKWDRPLDCLLATKWLFCDLSTRVPKASVSVPSPDFVRVLYVVLRGTDSTSECTFASKYLHDSTSSFPVYSAASGELSRSRSF